jgi:hypothetical protein
MSKIVKSALLALIFLTVIIPSCSKKKSTKPEPPDTIISDKVVVLEEETGVSLDTVKDSTYTFTFTGQPPKVSKNDILVGTEGGGYLRRVVSVTTKDNSITLQTGYAVLTDAIIKGSLDTTIQLNIEKLHKQTIQGLGLIYAAKGVSVTDGIIDLSGVELFSGKVGGTDVTVSIIEGSISFNPSLDLGFEIENSGIKDFHALAKGALAFNCDLGVTASDEFTYSKEVNIATFKHIAVQFVGPVPIVEVITLSFDAGFESAISIGGTTEFGFESNIVTSFGARYRNGAWSTVWDKETNLIQHPVIWKAEAEAQIRGYIKPSISIDLYAVAGPYLEVEPYLAFTGEITSYPLWYWYWRLYGGIEGDLGFHVSILSNTLFDYSAELFNWEMTIAADSNSSPNTASNPSPSNGASNQSIDADLSWTGGDPDADPVTYDVYFGTNSSPPLVFPGQTSTTYDPGTLNYNTKYYWKIVSKDNRGGQTTGPVWNFTTGAQPNNPPYTPSNPSPSNGATKQSIDVDLGWTGGDPDGDPVTYDVYFGTSSSPPLVSPGQASTTYDPGTLSYNTKYYWKIVSKDNRGGQTTGPVWNFTTGAQPNNPPYTPSNPSPSNGATNQSIDVDLSWTGGDPDGDPVTYNVYFGTSSSPPLVSPGQTSTTYDPGTLNYSTKYYWKIVSQDNRGGQTTGSVWNFTTKSSSGVVEFVGSYDTPDVAMGVFVSGNYAYIADFNSGLQVINISNPSNPVKAGSYDTPGAAEGVFVSGNYAYVADGYSGLQVINVSNPSNPAKAGSYDTPGWAEGVFVSGNYAYLADGTSGLQVISISNPSNPTLSGTYDTPSHAWDVFVSGNYAYVADGYPSGLQVIDISNPSTPTLVGSYGGPSAVDVFVSGDYAYVLDCNLGLLVLNIFNPSNPTLVGSYDIPETMTEGVFVSANYAYVAEYDSGVQVINISNPSNPVKAGSYDTPGLAVGVFVSGNYIYVADYWPGLQILRFVP